MHFAIAAGTLTRKSPIEIIHIASISALTCGHYNGQGGRQQHSQNDEMLTVPLRKCA